MPAKASVIKKLTMPLLRQRSEAAHDSLPDMILQAEKAVHHILTGHHAQKRAGTGEKFWQFREYDPSDRPQDIDWRQSAKTDRVYVRQKEWQTTQTAMIWAQNNENMTYASDQAIASKGDTAKILALAIGMMLSKTGELITSLELSSQAGRSDHAIEKLGRALLDIETGDLPDIQKAAVKKNCSLILVSDFLAPIEEIEECFSSLAAQADNAVIIQVLDPTELTMPFEGRIVFEAPGTHDDYLIENVEAVRADYLDVLNRQIRNIKQLCHLHQWNWVLHSTDSPIRQTLTDIQLMLNLTAAAANSSGGHI